MGKYKVSRHQLRLIQVVILFLTKKFTEFSIDSSDTFTHVIGEFVKSVESNSFITHKRMWRKLDSCGSLKFSQSIFSLTNTLASRMAVSSFNYNYNKNN